MHASAWKKAFEQFFAGWTRSTGDRPEPFTVASDYERYVDGRNRLDGARAVLASRGITLPEGDPADPAGSATLHGVGNLENHLFLEALDEGGVEVFDDAVDYVREVRTNGLPRAVVSASANTARGGSRPRASTTSSTPCSMAAWQRPGI